MSNEIERAFVTLGEDADGVRLDAAPTVRKRSDRRRAAQALAGVTAVAVLVTGVSFGARFLSGPDRPVPLPAPADTSSPSPSPSPSPSTSTPPSSPASSPSSAQAPTTRTPVTRPIPKSIPARAFLQKTDVPGDYRQAPERMGQGDIALPRFCDRNYENTSRIGIRATQKLYFYTKNGVPDSTPKAVVYQDVVVYRSDGAQRFLDDLRAAVGDCRSDVDDSGVTVKFYLRGKVGAGDDSVLIEQTRPAYSEAGEFVGDGSLDHKYWAAVRVGDSIAFVANDGWESTSSTRADTVHLAQHAADRLSAWRS